MKKTLSVLLLTIVAASLSSCRSAAGGDTVVIRRAPRLVRTVPELLSGDPALAMLDDAAVLSDAAYEAPHTPVVVGKDCDLSSGDRDFVTASLAGWEEVFARPSIASPRSRQVDLSSLHFRIWEKKQANRMVVLVAFRGTRPTNLRDWFANLRYATRFIPGVGDAYEELRALTPSLIEMLNQTHPDAEIVTAGHSLGGGLAQAMAYHSCGRIRTVFAFNPSVVTDKADALDRCKQRGVDAGTAFRNLSIYRAFERGEVLWYLRWLFSKFRDISEQVVMIKYDLRSGNTIRLHGMESFACELLRLHARHELREEPVK